MLELSHYFGRVAVLITDQHVWLGTHHRGVLTRVKFSDGLGRHRHADLIPYFVLLSLSPI
jgi:hypothetical protein